MNYATQKIYAFDASKTHSLPIWPCFKIALRSYSTIVHSFFLWFNILVLGFRNTIHCHHFLWLSKSF